MKLNLEIDDKLLTNAKNISGITDHNKLIVEALKLFVKVNKQKNLRNLRGKLRWE